MKAISIRPPWAWAILHAGKDIENRTWRTSMRGTVAVHAFLNMNRLYYEWACKEIKRIAPRAKVPPYEAVSRGSIIGVVEGITVSGLLTHIRYASRFLAKVDSASGKCPPASLVAFPI